jgi:hypothetical protein
MRQARLPIILVLVFSLVVAGVTRSWADYLRGTRTTEATSGSSLSGMNSFGLGLLLGGLRGPLVMFLWSTSESQKSADDLEDFDTKVEWIRLLQPEFDTVHIFQIWNKAYNISVKMTSLSNKYTTIIDAIDYADRVDDERPNNISILSAKGGVFFDKLGNSTEKWYYKDRVRRETAFHANKAPVQGARRLELESMVDADGKIRKELLKPGNTHLQDKDDPSLVYDGSDLQFLPRWEPYAYGLSPYAIAYDYHKRSQVLQRVGKQTHPQLSDLVVDSRPALSLKFWAEDEWERGRRAEIEAFGMAAPLATAERIETETVSMRAPLTTPIAKPAALDRAIYSYDIAAKLCADSELEYQLHLRKYTANAFTYQSHRDGLLAQKYLMLGDRDYLKAMRAGDAERPALLASARKSYEQAKLWQQLMIIKYCASDTNVAELLPQGVTKENLSEHPELVPALAAKAQEWIQRGGQDSLYSEDYEEYARYVTRAQTRLDLLPK